MIARVVKMRLYRPQPVGLLLRDLLRRRGPVLDTRVHLEEAARWLLRAQAATPDDGVAAAYSFEDAWVASYPETTGYIIPTLLTYAELSGTPEYRHAALAMAEWELTVQHPGGGFPGHFVDQDHPPAVFNTGQVIFGLLAAHLATGEGRFLDAAMRAGRWLVAVQDADGAWRRWDYRGALHVYTTRVAWPLVELGLVTGDARLVEAGERNLNWALTQQEPNGWFRHCAFSPDEDPFLHTIAYASQGLLEAGLRLQRPEYVAAAERVCRAVLRRADADGFLPATFDAGWNSTARYSCLTGNAQMAAQWLRLYEFEQDRAFLDGACRITRLLKRLQDCATTDLTIRGALKGSHPIWGRYLFGTYPNWAVKFFMDALMLEAALTAGERPCIRCW